MKPDVAETISTSVFSFGITERDASRREREEKLRQNGQIRFSAQNKKLAILDFICFQKGRNIFPTRTGAHSKIIIIITNSAAGMYNNGE